MQSSFISPESKQEIRDFLHQSGKYNKRTSEYTEKVHELIEKEALAKGKSTSQVQYPSRTTLGRLELEQGIYTGNTEETTDARAIAVAAVRNAVSFAAMNQFVAPLIDPHLILNADATQFTVGNTSAENENV